MLIPPLLAPRGHTIRPGQARLDKALHGGQNSESMVNFLLRENQKSGGCQCGAVRYRIAGELGKAGICHCRMCQKAFGNFGSALVSVEATVLTWTRGQPSEFRSSAVVARGFCAACGTPLYMREDGDPNVEIAIGSLDDPNDIGPMTEQVGSESRVDWFQSMAELPSWRTDERRSAEDLRKLASMQHPDHDTEQWP